MARYLTPSKVSLLGLAVLYHEGVVPTSEKTSILGFLISHILPESKHPSAVSSEDFEHVVPISAFEASLSKHSSVMPGRTIYDLLLKKIWAIDCSDALDNFFTTLPFLLNKSREQILRERETGMVIEQKGKILRTSPMGAFIRRCHLEYMRLQFQDAIALWQELIAYKAPTRQAYEKKNHPDDRSPPDVNISELHMDSSHPLTLIMYGSLAETEEQQPAGFSTYDVEKLMEFQVSEMQRLGGRLPEDMRGKLNQISKTGVPVPKLGHYLKFLDSWRAGDYTSAFDNLHRYFDYTMQSRDRTFYQYALLNLAILQADFACYGEAIPAMQEAIATARENKDTTCLNFCMSWLYHFGRTFPSEMKNIKESGILGSETEGLAFLKSRAKDAEMWSLLSTSLLSEAKLGLQYGDSLAAVFENIAKASHINVTKAVQNVTGPTLLMRASTFTRVGLAHLAWSCSETFMECHSKDAPIEDILKCTCRMASLLTQRGRYSEADEIMASLPPHILRVLKYKNYCMFYSGLLKLRRFIHRNDLEAADRIAHQLHGQGAPDLEIGFSFSFLQVELLLRRGNLEKALSDLEKLAERAAAENNDVVVHCRLLNIKARIWALASKPLKGFSVVMRAAQMAYRARVLPSLWDSVGILCNILVHLREYQPAANLLQSIMPQVLECEDCDLAAHTYSYLADACMGQAGGEEEKSIRREEHMSKAVEYVQSAFIQYKFVEDMTGQLDMLHKKARIERWRGDAVLANDTASQYLELKRECEKTHL